MKENLPQLIYLALVFLGLGSSISRGKDTLINIVATATVLGLLYWGGFFNGLLGL